MEKKIQAKAVTGDSKGGVKEGALEGVMPGEADDLPEETRGRRKLCDINIQMSSRVQILQEFIGVLYNDSFSFWCWSPLFFPFGEKSRPFPSIIFHFSYPSTK